MSKNVYRQLFNNDLELTLRDTQDNLEEFMLMLSNNSDMNTFDIISITRTDDDSQYTQTYKHPRVTTQSARVAAESAQVIPLPRRAQG